MRIGLYELALVAASLVCIAGLVVGAVVLILARSSTQRTSADRMAALEEENRRLRADLDNLKKE